MPVGFLNDSHTREYGRFPGELTPDQLASYFHLDDADRAFIALHRGDHNRLGVAVQLGSLRMLGVFQDKLDEVPVSALRYTAHQLSITEHKGLITDKAVAKSAVLLIGSKRSVLSRADCPPSTDCRQAW